MGQHWDISTFTPGMYALATTMVSSIQIHMNCSHTFNQLHYVLSGQGEFKAAKTDTCDLVAYYKHIKLGVFVANWQLPSMHARCDH